jgi:hypothetical protein
VRAYPDKELAAHVDLTLQVLTRVLTDLAAQGLLAHEPRQLVALPALAARWVAAYPRLAERYLPDLIAAPSA